jgi:hypothetical protein
LKYPAVPGGDPTTRGYLPFARQILGPAGLPLGYQLVIVAYDKYTPGSAVNPKSLQITGMTASGVVPPVATLSGSDVPPVGSPLIVARNGNYAKIIEFNGSTHEATLDHEIEVSTPEDAYIIVDDGARGRNCVMMVLVAETLLRPGP